MEDRFRDALKNALGSEHLQTIFPFFLFYTLLFAMLTVGDLVSVSLFVKRAGSHNLPYFYALIAIVNGALTLLYWRVLSRFSALRLFYILIAGSVLTTLACWLLLKVILMDKEQKWWVYGVLFINREVTFTFILLHFGNFLQDYFDREAMNKALVFIYAGGRLGSLLAGLLMAITSTMMPIVNFLWVYIALGGASLWFLKPLTHKRALVRLPFEAYALTTETDSFWRYARQVPLLWWFVLSMFFFIMTRWFLNFEYNHFFGEYFEKASHYSAFLGWYTVFGMTASLLIQLLFVNRWVSKLGMGTCFFVYHAALAVVIGLQFLFPSVATATMARFIETDLRMSLRNPVNMMIANEFEIHWRPKIRTLSMGLAVPLATLAASGLLLFTVQGNGDNEHLTWVGKGAMTFFVVLLLWTVWQIRVRLGVRQEREAAQTQE